MICNTSLTVFLYPTGLSLLESFSSLLRTCLFNIEIVFLGMALFCFSPQLGSERRPLLHYRGN